MKLEGHVALVTGSGRNIGRAIALAFAKEGANVIVNSRSNQGEIEAVAQEIRGLGREALPILADMADRDDIDRMMRTALETFGKVDILVNNAAIRPHASITDMTYEEWRRVLAVDLDAAFLTIKAALPGMLAQRWGRIINIAGLRALMGHPGRAHVSAAKMGLVGLTRTLGQELAPSGVLVNCISPGLFNTSQDPSAAARGQQIPVGRLGEPEDIARLCVYLASDDAAFVTGQTFHVNGGELCY